MSLLPDIIYGQLQGSHTPPPALQPSLTLCHFVLNLVKYFVADFKKNIM